MISYAQNFEDVMLARLFSDKEKGFYVDVGAADPVNLSVTKWFYDKGWSGINIEPNKKLFERLAADRPRDINLNCGAGAISGEVPLFEPEVGELSTFDVRAQQEAKKSHTPGIMRPVSVRRLNDILKKHLNKRTIDFLKIDVEGWEYEVLKGTDLKRYRPIVVLVEATVPQETTASYQKWEALVLDADYAFVYFDGVNRFYLSKERSELKTHFSRPPNVFDDFEPIALVRARTDADERLAAMHKLESILLSADRDRRERDLQVQKLNSLLQQATKDSAERLSRMNELQTNLVEANADRAARLGQIERLTALLAEANDDRAARLDQIEQLTALLAEANNDRAARLDQIEQLTALLAEANNDRAARLSQIEQLNDLLAEANDDRAARLNQVEQLGALLTEANVDRAARLAQMQQLGMLLAQASSERDERLSQIHSLQERLDEAQRALAERLERIERLELLQQNANQQLEAGAVRILGLERHLQETAAALDRILQSRFWKMTHPKWLRKY